MMFYFRTRDCSSVTRIAPRLQCDGGRPREGRCQTVCKPGSVPRLPAAMAIPLGRTLRGASSNQPGRQRGKRLRCREAATPSLFGLAPGEVCRAGPIAGPAVRSYRTFSPLPAGRSRPAVYFSVALSRGSPPPGVTRHRFSVEPGLSSPNAAKRWPRPSDRLASIACSDGDPWNSSGCRRGAPQRSFHG